MGDNAFAGSIVGSVSGFSVLSRRQAGFGNPADSPALYHL
jgi:hypothetical protein